MMYNLFLDDERKPSDVTWVELPLVEWTVVKTHEQFMETINKRGMPLRVSFDHDLHPEHYHEYHAAKAAGRPFSYERLEVKTGYHCAAWMAYICVHTKQPLPEYFVHTMNDVGASNIREILDTASSIQSQPPG